MNKNDLELHPSCLIIDSSKLKVYERCMRAFFFEYILGWRIEGPNNNLIFGEAWHRAMEYILTHGFTVKSVIKAAKIGEKYIREYFSPLDDAVNGAKIPGVIPIALAEYIARYKSDRFEILYTEVGDCVPINESGRLLYFRIDAIVKDKDNHDLIVGLEHKTSGRRGYFEQYTTDIANGAYNHVLYSVFEPEEVYGMMVNGIVILKKERDFQRLPARRKPESMMEWLWTVNHWYDRFEWDLAELGECSEGDAVMTAFAKQTEDCFKYGKCKYCDLCHAWTNPLQHAEQPPPGFEVERWDPRERSKKATFNPDGTITQIEEEKDDNLSRGRPVNDVGGSALAVPSNPEGKSTNAIKKAREKVAEATRNST